MKNQKLKASLDKMMANRKGNPGVKSKDVYAAVKDDPCPFTSPAAVEKLMVDAEDNRIPSAREFQNEWVDNNIRKADKVDVPPPKVRTKTRGRVDKKKLKWRKLNSKGTGTQ